MSRIAPVSAKSDVPAEHHALVDKVLKVFGGIRGPFSMMLHSPKMAGPVFDLGDYFRDDSIVEPRLRSVGILIAARERQGAYVWGAQVNAARRNGVPEEVLELIRQRAAPARYPAGDREVAAYTEQLMRTNRVEQSTFDALKNGHSVQWLVELTAVINYYGMLCGIVSAFEVPGQANADPLPK
ncbi:MAG TPA: carboxymuconolactone decarboxylase family protein [Burkholderiales bacterium]|nr:carboxymuconolactone decarboxylase family protein [Burkholderiales bacterium]